MRQRHRITPLLVAVLRVVIEELIPATRHALIPVAVRKLHREPRSGVSQFTRLASAKTLTQPFVNSRVIH